MRQGTRERLRHFGITLEDPEEFNCRRQQEEEASPRSATVRLLMSEEEMVKKLETATRGLRESYRKLEAQVASRRARVRGRPASHTELSTLERVQAPVQEAIEGCQRMSAFWAILASLLSTLRRPNGEAQFDPLIVKRSLVKANKEFRALVAHLGLQNEAEPVRAPESETIH